jgi:uncharacterized protein with HEPN domain
MPKRSKSSKKDPRVRIAHILDSIDAVETYLAGASLDSFARDAKTQDAVTRRLEIIGEAVISLDSLAPDLLAGHPGVPWKSIKGMREKLAHDYDTVSVTILWNTATRELPLLRDAVRTLAQEAKLSRPDADG